MTANVKKCQYYIPIFMQKIGYIVFFILHHIFVRLEVRGRENLQNLNGPIILAPNHTGELDVTVMPQALPFISKFFPIYYTTYPDQKYKDSDLFGFRSYIYGGKFFESLGGCQIYPGQKNYEVSLQNHIALLKTGHTVCIFSEGKCTTDGNLREAHGGLGYLVYTTGATVVPVVINTFYNMNWKIYFGFKRKVTMTILKPMSKNEVIDVQNPTVSDFRSASQKVLDRIKEVLK